MQLDDLCKLALLESAGVIILVPDKSVSGRSKFFAALNAAKLLDYD